jgi:hypothetical protein
LKEILLSEDKVSAVPPFGLLNSSVIFVPASRTSTDVDLSSDNSLAITPPAVPAPITI